MAENVLPRAKRNALIRKFRKAARMNVLTAEDGIKILDILLNACRRSKTELDEETLKKLIEKGGDHEC